MQIQGQGVKYSYKNRGSYEYVCRYWGRVIIYSY
jgi:hypothetical protein